MDIASISNTTATSRLSSVSVEVSSRSHRATESASHRDADRIEVSPQGRQAAAEIRRDLVDRVKLEIHAGTYENINKLNTAIDRMMSDLSEA